MPFMIFAASVRHVFFGFVNNLIDQIKHMDKEQGTDGAPDE
jgi:hypothetical protein